MFFNNLIFFDMFVLLRGYFGEFIVILSFIINGRFFKYGG